MNRRPGFALMTVLWVMVAVAALAAAGALSGRDAIAASANRVESERAFWLANGCLNTIRAALDDALGEAAASLSIERTWRSLDRELPPLPSECLAQMSAAGSRLDVNEVSREQLFLAFRRLLVGDAERVAAAIVEQRELEGPIAHLSQLRLPFDASGVLGVEPGRIALNSAPLPVLASIPGFTYDLLDRIGLDRATGQQIIDILALAQSASRSAGDSVIAHFPEISRMAVVNPDAWILTVRATSGSPRAEAVMECRLVLGPRHAALTRVRAW